MRDDGGSYQSENSGGGEKWSNFGYGLKIEPMKFLYELDEGCVWE